MQTPESNDELLRAAIEQRRLVRLIYRNRDRVVEPHDYGIQNGYVKLLAYQVAGSSSGKLPNWRWMETDLISDIRLLNQTFPGGRPTPSGKHHEWDQLFSRVKPADTDQHQATHLPVDDHIHATWDSAKLAGAIADLGYPRFRQLSGGSKMNPAIVLLAALSGDDLEVRIIEALPWLVVRYYELDWDWLLARIKQRHAQNRLGFIVTLGRRIADKQANQCASNRLRQIEETLRRARLVCEDTLCQASLSDAERRWLRNSRPKDAKYWNLLTDLDSEHLSYGA